MKRHALTYMHLHGLFYSPVYAVLIIVDKAAGKWWEIISVCFLVYHTYTSFLFKKSLIPVKTKPNVSSGSSYYESIGKLLPVAR